jgi:gliding motility-associated-like protein
MDSCLYPANAIPPRIWIPNVFSPNGDGENDSFIISGSGIEFYELIIFNRWGGKIFESINLDHVWDGSYRGKQVPDGVYMVIVRYRFMGQQENRYYGTVTVLH